MTQTELTPTTSLTGKWMPYFAYKDSGVEWLGEIPEHWEVKKIKRLCQVKRGASPRPIDDTIYFDDQGEYAWVRISDVTASNKFLQKTEQKLSLFGQSKSVCLEPGELFLSIAGSVGKPIITQIKCCIHDGFVYFIGMNLDKEFLFYVFSGEGLYKGLGKLGTQLNLNTDTIGDIRIPVPTQIEQHSIATYLNRETARIDALIAKKERLIELLQEKRAALISHAVTKGLDPTVPMKDSGVEWLREIPEHWEVAPVYSRYTVQLGKMLNQEAVKGISPAPYLRNANIQWDYIELCEILEMDFNPSERLKYNLIFGDLLVCEGGEVGRTAIWRDELTECYFQKAIHRVRPLSTQEDGRFLFYVLFAAANLGVFKAEGNKSTIVHLTAEKLKSHKFAFPSLTEQRSIISFLDRETAKIDALVSRIHEGIEKLKEYSAALISAAVTGKIDVRGKILSMDETGS